MPARLSVFLVYIPLIVSLPAPDPTRQARIDLVMGMANNFDAIHYALLTFQDNKEEVPVNYHDAVALGLATGDLVELDLEDDQTSAPPHHVQGHPGVRPKRIGRVRSHQKMVQQKAASTGLRSALAIRMNYQDTPENQCTEACVLTNMYTSAQSVQAMYLENSYGALRFDTSTTSTKPRVITVSIGRSIGDPCGSVQSTLDQISTEGDAAVQAAGISVSQYDIKVYFTPAICGIGVSFIAETRSYINSGSSDTVAHELGHTFGVGHTSLDSANFPRNFQVTFGQSQDVILEYGDVAGVMGISGFGMRGMVGPHRNQLGWIPSSAILTPSLTACPIAITLRTLFTTPDATGVSLVRIPKASGGSYFISFRTPQGQDSNVPYANMVGIHSFTGGSANTFLWKYVAAGESETTSDGLVLSVARVQSSTADITLAQNGVGQSCTTLSPSPSPATQSMTPSFTPTSSPTPTNRATVQCGQTVQGSNVGRSNEFDLTGSDGADVAFVFQIVGTTSVTFSMCNQANFDTLLQVFGADKVTSFGFNDDTSGCGLTSVLTANLAAGSYFVVVDGFDGATGSFSLTVTCPSPNPTPTTTTTPAGTPDPSPSASETPSTSRSADPTPLPSDDPTTTPTSFNTPSQTLSATNSPSSAATPTPTPTTIGTIQCGQTVQGSNFGTANTFDVSGRDGSDVAFVFDVTDATAVTFSTCNQANFDTLLQVFAADRVSGFGFNDDARGCGLTSAVTVTLHAGSYFIVVDGFSGATGDFSLSATCVTSSQTPSASLTRQQTPSPSVSPQVIPRSTIHCGQSVQGTNVGTPNGFTLVRGDGSDVAFDFAVTSPTIATFSTCNHATFDTVLGLFSGENTLVSIADDSSRCQRTSVLTATLAPGNYIVVVDGFGGATGTFTLTVTCQAVSSSHTVTRSPTSTRSSTRSHTATKSHTRSVTRSRTRSRHA